MSTQTDFNNSEPEKNGFWKEAYDWAESICISLAIVMFLFSFCFKTVEVWGPSMEDTLHGRDIDNVISTSGDKLLISNLFYTPECGDIIVIQSDYEEETIIKRVIATEGQEVDIDFSTGEVKVDGEVLDEPYIKNLTTKSGNVDFPVTVPEDCVFVLGDNREVSLDSRYTVIGMVNTNDILGRVVLRIYPFSQFGTVK